MKNRGLIIGIAGVALIAIGVFMSYVSFYNTAVKLENTTAAQFQNNKNTYDAFWKSVQEVAQVPGQYKDDFKELLVDETKAKFGEGGSKAAFQWFKDRDINFDASMYKKIQDVIEAGRADFKRGQTELLDKQRRYKDHLGSFWGSMWAGMSGHPKVVSGELAPKKDIDGDGFLTCLDYPIITSSKTEKVFDEGLDDEPVNVFGDKK